MLISKFVISQTGKQVIQSTHSPISREIKVIRTFGQLMARNMRNIFLEKSYTKCAGETIVLGPFQKNRN